MNRRWHRRALLSLVALLLAAGCSSSDSDDAADPTTTTAPAVAFPSAEWARTSPAEAGLDETRLDELERSLQEQNSSCMAVVKDVVVRWASTRRPRGCRQALAKQGKGK